MDVLNPGYQRPGISVLTVVANEQHAELFVDWLPVVLPEVEQVVVGWMASATQPPSMQHPKLKLVAIPHPPWGAGRAVRHAHVHVAKLAEHQWSMNLDVHYRPTPAEWETIRSLVRVAGRAPIATRLAGQALEHATPYRARLWRTGWNLRNDDEGFLHQLDCGGQLALDASIVDDLESVYRGRLFPRDSLATATGFAQLGRVAGTTPGAVIVTGAPGTQLKPLTDRLAAVGVQDVTEDRGADPGMRSLNNLLLLDSIAQDTPWAWAHDVITRADPIHAQVRSHITKQAARLAQSPTWMAADVAFCQTLSTWAAHTEVASLVVVVANPLSLAHRLWVQRGVPTQDGLRIWYQSMRNLLHQIESLGLACVFVDEALAEAPTAALCARIANLFGLSSTISDLDADRAARPDHQPDASVAQTIAELMRDVARPGESEAMSKLFGALWTLTQKPEPYACTRAEGAELGHGCTVLMWHDSSQEQLDKAIQTTLGSASTRQTVQLIVLMPAARSTQSEPSDYQMVWADGALESTATLWNRGLACAQHEVVVFATSSVPVEPGVLSLHVRAHATRQHSPRRIFSGGVTLPTDGSGQPDLLLSVLSHGDHLLRRRLMSEETALLPTHHVPINSSVRRAALASIGGFDPRLTDGTEFVDLTLRLAHAGVHARPLAGAAVARRTGLEVGQALSDYIRFCNALAQLVQIHPLYFTPGRLQTDMRNALPQIAALPNLRHDLPALQSRSSAAGAQDSNTRQSFVDQCIQALRLSLLEGFSTADPSIVRTLGTQLWQDISARLGERWNGRSPSAIKQAVESNRERCLALNGKHAGETVFVLGCGPQLHSLTEKQRRALAARVCVAVNEAHYVVEPRYQLSAYASYPQVARRRLPDTTTVLHMRPMLQPPLVEGILAVKRAIYEGSLPRRFTDSLELLTKNNVSFGATHLAYILGASRIVYVGVELRSLAHFYCLDSSLREHIRQDAERLLDTTYIGIDHPYERPHQLTHLKYARSQADDVSNFLDYDHLNTYRSYFGEMRRTGVTCFVTAEDSLLREAGAEYRPIDAFLED